MKSRHGLFLVVAAYACAGSDRHVVAWGLASGMNYSLARTTAENRGIANLQKMMTLDAVKFAYLACEEDSAVELVNAGGKASFDRAEYLPLANGWASKVTGMRPQAVVEAMQDLTFASATGEAHREDLGTALMVAESRAVRALLAPLAQDCSAPGCRLTGTLTFRNWTPEFLDDGIRLRITASIKTGAKQTLTAADRMTLHKNAVAEYGQERQWDRAFASLDKAVAAEPNEASLYALRGMVLLQRGPVSSGNAVVGMQPKTTPGIATSGGQPVGGTPTAEDPLRPARIANLKEAIAAFTKAANLDAENWGYKQQLNNAKLQLAALEDPAGIAPAAPTTSPSMATPWPPPPDFAGPTPSAPGMGATPFGRPPPTTSLPRPPGSPSSGSGGSANSETMSQVEEAFVARLPLTACADFYVAELRKLKGKVVATPRSAKATALAVLSASQLAVVLLESRDERNTDVRLFTMTRKPGTRNTEPPRIQRRPGASNTPDGFPLAVAPGSWTTSNSRADMYRSLDVISTEPVNAARTHYQKQMEQLKLQSTSAVLDDGSTVFLGVGGNPHLMVAIYLLGDARGSEAYFKCKNDADSPDAGIARGRGRTGMLAIEPGFTVGKPIPEGLPVILAGGSNVKVGTRIEESGGGVKYHVETNVAYTLRIGGMPTEETGAQRLVGYYKGELGTLKLGVTERKAENGRDTVLAGEGKQGTCTIVIADNGDTTLDCLWKP
jgi:tetratricopeptide (TPR) repeat protein